VSSRKKSRVAVIFGGRSPEHPISCISAGSVLAALDSEEYDVVPVGITRDGRWLLISGDDKPFTITDGRLPEVTEASGDMIPLVPGRVPGEVDVAFPVLHGAYGEDGTIQGLFEMAGLPYVGAGVFASAAGMDKEFTKKLAAAAGIPVGPYTVLRGDNTLSEEDRQRLGLPLFVKPCRGGSSIGISKVSTWDELDAALSKARAIDPKVIIEAGVVGREIECGVLEGETGGPAEASRPAEIRVVRDHEFYDFEAKYLDADDACEFDLPPDLPGDVIERVQDYAVRTFDALDCAGLARVDFFVTADYQIYLNEINTMPGFTPISMFAQMWAASGLEYPRLVSRLIRTALRRGTGLH
jgi:D-alanine-D-alanine ligase